MTKIYIAGKVTGLDPEQTKLKFSLASIELTQKGFEVANPISIVKNSQANWNEAMKLCIAELVTCDAVLLLPCHINSKGAIIEKKLCDDLEIKTFESMWCLTQYFRNR